MRWRRRVGCGACVVLALCGCRTGDERVDARSLAVRSLALRDGFPVKYAEDVAAIEARYDAVPREPGGVILVGSSIFRLWADAREHLSPWRVDNHAFGGSRTWEQLAYMDRLVLAFEPSAVVYYAGSNDVNYFEAPGEAEARGIAERFVVFAERVRAERPGAAVLYVSINRAPQKRERWRVVDAANAAVRGYCDATAGVWFVDVNPGLFEGGDVASGVVRDALYRGDRLHFERAAYAEVFGPAVRAGLAAAGVPAE